MLNSTPVCRGEVSVASNKAVGYQQFHQRPIFDPITSTDDLFMQPLETTTNSTCSDFSWHSELNALVEGEETGLTADFPPAEKTEG
jgi:hypothetical protein